MDNSLIKNIVTMKRELQALKYPQAIAGNAARFYRYDSSGVEFSGVITLSSGGNTDFERTLTITTDKPAVIEVFVTRSINGGQYSSANQPQLYRANFGNDGYITTNVFGDVIDVNPDEKVKSVRIHTYVDTSFGSNPSNPIINQDFKVSIVSSQPFTFKLI